MSRLAQNQSDRAKGLLTFAAFQLRVSGDPLDDRCKLELPCSVIRRQTSVAATRHYRAPSPKCCLVAPNR